MTNRPKRVCTNNNNNNNNQWSLSTLMCSCCCKSNSYCSDDDYENEHSQHGRDDNNNAEIAYLINDACRDTVVLEDNVFDEADDKNFPHPILVADYWTSIDRRPSRRLFGSANNNGQEVSFCKSPTKSDVSSSSIYSPSTKRRIMELLSSRFRSSKRISSSKRAPFENINDVINSPDKVFIKSTPTYIRSSPLSTPGIYPNLSNVNSPFSSSFEPKNVQIFDFCPTNRHHDITNRSSLSSKNGDRIQFLKNVQNYHQQQQAGQFFSTAATGAENTPCCASTMMRGRICVSRNSCINNTAAESTSRAAAPSSANTGQWCCPFPVLVGGQEQKNIEVSSNNEAYTRSFKVPDNIDLHGNVASSNDTTGNCSYREKKSKIMINNDANFNTDVIDGYFYERSSVFDQNLRRMSRDGYLRRERNFNDFSRNRNPGVNEIRRMNDCAPYREENSLQLSIYAAKGLTQKKLFFCEICLDNCRILKTTAKLKSNDECFWGEHFELNGLRKFNKIIVNLYKYSDSKKNWSRNNRNLIGFVAIPIKNISETYPIEKWYPVAIINSLSKTAVISLRIKARFQTVYVLPLRAYESLLEYLKSDYLTVCSAVENLTNVKAKEDIATCIVRVLHDQNLAKDFLCDLVMREVSALDNYHLLFRGNSLATKAMEAFMKLTGQTYLKQTLSEFIENTLSSKEVYEVDPSKLSNLASLSRHQECLTKRAKAIWAKILLSAPDFPMELNQVFKELRQRLTVNGLSELADYLISSNIFLRFLCPAIMSPSLFHIVKQYPNEASVRNLTLIAKTIQNLANFTKFGSKESFMGFMNKFVEEEMENMHCFLTSISALNHNCIVIGQSGCQTPIDLAKQLSLLHSYLSETWTASSNSPATKSNRNYDQLKDIVQSIDVALIQAKQLRISKASYQDASWVKTASRSLSMSVTSRDDENVERAEIVCDGRRVMRDSLAESNYDNNNNDKDINERVNRSKIEEKRVNDHLAKCETYFQENIPVEIDPMQKYSNRRYTFCAGSTKMPVDDHDEDPLKQLQNNFAAAAKSLTSPLSSSTAANTGDCCSFYERFRPVENSSRCSLANEQAGSSGYHSSTYSTSHSNSPIENAAYNCCSCRRYALECTTLDVQPQVLSAKNRKMSRRPSVDAHRISTSENRQDTALLNIDHPTKRRQASSRERSPSLLSLPNFLSTFRRTSESIFHFKTDNTKNADSRRDVENENFCSTNRLSYTGASRFFTPPFSRWRQSSTTPINRSLANSFATAQSTISMNSDEKNLSKLRLIPATNQSRTTASLDCRSKSSSQSISSFGGRSNAVPRTNPRFVMMNGLRNSFKSLTNTLPNTLNNTFKISTMSTTGKNRSTTLPSFSNGREGALEKSIQSLNFDNDDVILRDVSFTLSHDESDSNRASPSDDSACKGSSHLTPRQSVYDSRSEESVTIGSDRFVDQQRHKSADFLINDRMDCNAIHQQNRIEILQSANEKLMQTLNDLKIIAADTNPAQNQSLNTLSGNKSTLGAFSDDDIPNSNNNFVSCQDFDIASIDNNKRSISIYDDASSSNDHVFSANDIFEQGTMAPRNSVHRNSLSCLKSTPDIRTSSAAVVNNMQISLTPRSQINVSYC